MKSRILFHKNFFHSDSLVQPSNTFIINQDQRQENKPYKFLSESNKLNLKKSFETDEIKSVVSEEYSLLEFDAIQYSQRKISEEEFTNKEYSHLFENLTSRNTLLNFDKNQVFDIKNNSEFQFKINTSFVADNKHDILNYEKMAFQNLPEKLIQMQKTIKTYHTGDFFIFVLLKHYFMTKKLLTMFKGKSLMEICSYLLKKSEINFIQNYSSVNFERILNNPDLNLVFIQKNHNNNNLCFSENSDENDQIKNQFESNLNLKEQPFKFNHELSDKSSLSKNQIRFIKKFLSEENKLLTRIRFEEKKRKILLNKQDDIIELKFKNKRFQDFQIKIQKSKMREKFKNILWNVNFNICLSVGNKEQDLFNLKNCKYCLKGDFISFNIPSDFFDKNGYYNSFVISNIKQNKSNNGFIANVQTSKKGIFN